MSQTRKARVDEEEDLDDLDDLLEQFSAPPQRGPTQTQRSAAPPSSLSQSATSAAPSSNSNPDPPSADRFDLSDDFARELTMGMESLMREIASEAGLDGKENDLAGSGEDGAQTEEEKKREEAFRAAWEKMLVEGMNGALDIDELTGDASGKGKKKEGNEGSSAAAPNIESDDTFQASIKKAMEKLKESDANLQADAPDSVEAMVAQLTEGLDLGGEESEEELQKLFEGMMSQLMSKEILYEPLKELYTKFPDYLKDNAATISAEDKQRYDSQYVVVEKIVTIFDDPAYSDQDAEKNAQVVALMTEMQSFGSPPADIMGDLPPGLDLGPDGMPKLPEGCIIA